MTLKKLENEKFVVKIFEAKTFGNKVSKCHVLKPPIINTNPLATNQRKVYHSIKL